jgi:hypothetical protein
MQSLMLRAVAVINPSKVARIFLFIENRRRGKASSLIQVIRQRYPTKMLNVLDNCSSEREGQQLRDARVNLPQRVRYFAAHFEQIVLEAAESAK